jgi:transposase
MFELRKAVPTNDADWPAFTCGNPRYTNAHSDLRQSAFREFATCVKTAKQHGFPKHRKILFKYKRKKDRYESTSVSARCAGAGKGYFSNIFGAEEDGTPRMSNEDEVHRLRHNRKHPDTPRKAAPLVYSGEVDVVHDKLLDHYYFCIPADVKTAPAPDTQGRACAIDPGIRTMATCYDVSGLHGCTHWGGDHSYLKFVWISRKISRIQGRAMDPNTPHRSRRNMRRLMARLRKRLNDLADEMHHIFARWLCANFETVLLPEFKTSGMRCRKTRKIGKRSVKVLSCWSHYRFRQFLVHKAREFGTNVIICDEYLTSKTYGSCGSIDWKLGSAEVYRCAKCGYVADRDANAARNIFLRYMTLL